jgi:hypothetical protein
MAVFKRLEASIERVRVEIKAHQDRMIVIMKAGLEETGTAGDNKTEECLEVAAVGINWSNSRSNQRQCRFCMA